VKTSEQKIKNLFKLLGDSISQKRKKKKITLEQLGLDIGIDKSGMHHIENGKPITMTTFFKICAVLSVKPENVLKNLPILTKEDLD
jgi:DNA-binding Xre family transcriptional regulator